MDGAYFTVRKGKKGKSDRLAKIILLLERRAIFPFQEVKNHHLVTKTATYFVLPLAINTTHYSTVRKQDTLFLFVARLTTALTINKAHYSTVRKRGYIPRCLFLLRDSRQYA